MTYLLLDKLARADLFDIVMSFFFGSLGCLLLVLALLLVVAGLGTVAGAL